MPLIKDLDDFLKYIIVDLDIEVEKLLIFSTKAERKIKSLVGKEQYDEFVNMTEDDDVKDLLCSAAAQLGLLYALPSLKLRITNAGIYTTEVTDTWITEWWEIRDLHNSLKQLSFSEIDEALQMMEKDPINYPKFIHSENYTEIKSVLVTNAGTFQKYFNIENSRLTYLGLLPYLRECIDQYLLPWLGDCLYSLPESDKGFQLLEYLQKALVAFTIAKAADSGSFSFLNNTLIVKWEEMPWEKSDKISDTLLANLKEARESAGMNYLNFAKNLIKENLYEFPCLTQLENQKRDTLIFKRKSGLYLG